MDLDTVDELVPASGVTWRPGDAWLAGGTWLFSEPQPQVTRLLDLTAFDWPALAATADDLEIASTCTLAVLAAWDAPDDWLAWPLVRQCCDALQGSFKVCNTATVGGNLCLALPAGPMTALAVALEGRCTVWSPDGVIEQVAAVDFVTAPGQNLLGPGWLLRSVSLPIDALRTRCAFRRMSLSAYGRSAALVIGRRSASELVITVTASTPRPVQLRLPVDGTARAALAVLDDAVPEYHDDVHGDPRWRAAMTRRLVSEVIGELGDVR
jgi:CO/xanthine dehydrogenase FAD-binding subunit